MQHNKFILTTNLTPKGDQIKAIKQLTQNVKNKVKKQVLLGATGTGKTFTIANVIANTNKKTLVIVHNKTLAGQLYSEFKDLFKENKVEYFISYFDYYQPEAYLPSKDMYIEKSSKINQEIEMLRLSTIQSLATEEKVIVVASVASIYPSINPKTFNKYRIILNTGGKFDLNQFKYDLVKLQFTRNDVNLQPGSFRAKGDVIEIMEGTSDAYKIRISFFGNEIDQIAKVDTLTNEVIEYWKTYVIYPANEYIADDEEFGLSIKRIKDEFKQRVKEFKQKNKLVEAQRISDRTNRDIESLLETGFCSGIENYARHLELRSENQTPYSVFDYFGDDWLLVVDECHMTIPQIHGMYNGDRSRKMNLVDYGFRLPSALDNRPLKFEEFEKKLDQTIYVSATPGKWEIEQSKNVVVEQIVRPTGLLDPIIEIKPTANQINTLIEQIKIQVAKKQRTLVTVLTIKMAEELTSYLKDKKLKVAYLHNELKTMERTKVIDALRRGTFDVLIGINLLREGLDIPEVSLVAIFDANKPGIFRSYDSLIQTFGRTARNKEGRVILFADEINNQMLRAIEETNRRRKIQHNFNIKNNVTPQTIIKPISEELSSKMDAKIMEAIFNKDTLMTEKSSSRAIGILKKRMAQAAEKQEYEQAAAYRDMIIDLENKVK